MPADVADAHVTATEARGAGPPSQLRRRGCGLAYLMATVTLRASVVGRPFVSSTISNVAFPLAAFDIFIVIVFFDPAFSFGPAAFPAITLPVRVAAAPICAGHATPLGCT